MNRIWTGCALALPFLAHAACSLETPIDPVGTAGTSSTAGAGVQGGSVGTGGGGSGAVTAGTAGVSAVGGMAGTSSQGGSSPGTSGSTSTAGSGGSGGGTGGTGGGTGGSGGEAGLDLAKIVGKLDGRLVTMKCLDMPGADDCNSAGAVSEGMTKTCSGSKLDVQYDHPIGGTPGEMYKATMHFYGIMEPKNYGNNMGREAGDMQINPAAAPASPLPWHVFPAGMSYLASNYNSYEIHVLDQNMQEVGQYFLNSDTKDGHYTFVISYAKTIPIVGGGMVRLKIYDQNCRMIKNCGSSQTNDCTGKARTVDISAAMPQPGAALVQPGLGNPPQHAGQWVLIDVTGIEKM